jgi:CRP-like cAMP-binding protein
VHAYPAQAVIFHQDTPAHSVYLIEHGVVKLVRVAPNGHHMIMGLRYQYWLVGAPAVLIDKPYSFTAVTLVPSTLRSIPSKDFLYLARTNEQFSWHLLQMLSRKVFHHMKKMEAMSCLEAHERLEQLLSDMIREQAPGRSETTAFSLPLTNQELAQLLAITPEHLCRILKKMEREGLVRHDGGMLTVTDPAGLLQKSNA